MCVSSGGRDMRRIYGACWRWEKWAFGREIAVDGRVLVQNSCILNLPSKLEFNWPVVFMTRCFLTRKDVPFPWMQRFIHACWAIKSLQVLWAGVGVVMAGRLAAVSVPSRPPNSPGPQAPPVFRLPRNLSSTRSRLQPGNTPPRANSSSTWGIRPTSIWRSSGSISITGAKPLRLTARIYKGR